MIVIPNTKMEESVVNVHCSYPSMKLDWEAEFDLTTTVKEVFMKFFKVKLSSKTIIWINSTLKNGMITLEPFFKRIENFSITLQQLERQDNCIHLKCITCYTQP